jgi:hypothetical protein
MQPFGTAAGDQLKNLEFRSEIIARVIPTSHRHKAAVIQPEQSGPRNWTMVLPIPWYQPLSLDSRHCYHHQLEQYSAL